MSPSAPNTVPPIDARSRAQTDPAPPRKVVAPFDVGDLVAGSYEILSVLGEGGMGQVYEALDVNLDRRVAIKVAREPEHAKRLRNEARALAAFRHPSLVGVYTLGTHAERDFLVMERIYGINLAEHVAKRHAIGRDVAFVEAVEFLVAIAEGLAIVHRAGLAHRDVKLENVMLTPDGRVVLMDFGLVVPEFHSSAQGVIAGSPPYMAPETLNHAVEIGNGHYVDTYALGICAFELITGERPFKARTLQDLVEIHAAGVVPNVADSRPDAPERLSALVASMMAKNPSSRPATMESIAWQLRSIRDRELRTDRTTDRILPRDVFDVLIVDDDADIMRILEFYVRKALGKVNIRVAKDGVEAMERLEEREPDFMLLDLHMPRMNGIDVCMQMRGRRIAPSTTVISVSAGAQAHDRELMHQLGIHHFVEKGGTLRESLARIFREVAGTNP